MNAGSAQAPPPALPRAGAAELSLLAPLKEGGALDGFDVAEIDAVDASGQLRLVCRKGSAEVKLTVALQGEGGPEPPATAGRYAVFYATGGAPSGRGEGLALALAKILEANAAVPVPKGMASFKPQ